MLKIIGGEYRSRIIESPPDEAGQRPYLARIRESVFNLLRGWFEDARVLDLFAGVGTVGLEAVSRGAKTVLMVEKSPRTYKRLVANIEALGCGDRAIPMLGDALEVHREESRRAEPRQNRLPLRPWLIPMTPSSMTCNSVRRPAASNKSFATRPRHRKSRSNHRRPPTTNRPPPG